VDDYFFLMLFLIYDSHFSPAMLIARVVMGIGQAFNAPCAYPIIASLFSEETRSTANGIFAVGTYVGSALSSLSIVMAIALGWQATSIVAGLAGIIASVALYRTTDSVASGISASTACRLATGVQPPWVPPSADEEDETDNLLSNEKAKAAYTQRAAAAVMVNPPTTTTHQADDSSSSSQSGSSSTTPTLVENMTVLAQNTPVMLLFGECVDVLTMSLSLTQSFSLSSVFFYFQLYLSIWCMLCTLQFIYVFSHSKIKIKNKNK
jgi:MFS family permease